jgi:hypothetical protein
MEFSQVRLRSTFGSNERAGRLAPSAGLPKIGLKDPVRGDIPFASPGNAVR